MDIINWVKSTSEDLDTQESNLRLIQEFIENGQITDTAIIRNSKGNIVTIRGIYIVNSGQIALRAKKKKSSNLDPELVNDYFNSRKSVLN